MVNPKKPPAISPEFLKRARGVTYRYDAMWGVRTKQQVLGKIQDETIKAACAINRSAILDDLGDVLMVTLAAMHAIVVSDNGINTILGKTITKAERRVTEIEINHQQKQK